MEAGKKSIPGQKRDMKSIVRLRDTDYVGIVEAIWRIVTEETGAQRKRNMTEQDEGGVLSGIRQLYRGVSGVLPCQLFCRPFEGAA